MEIKGIDVSSYQGEIDWKTVDDYGMGFAILRITEKGNARDSQFENNYAGCIQYGIPVGVYKYSYALTVAEIQQEAERLWTFWMAGRLTSLCGWIWNGVSREPYRNPRSPR